MLLVLATMITSVLGNVIHTNHYGSLQDSQYDRPGEIEPAIKSMVSRMTLPEKIGQMTQINQDLVLLPDGTLNRTAVEYYANNYFVGSYLNQLSRLDHIHGAHFVANATIFPHGINLAASFNPQLAYDAAAITARDTRSAGVHWTFAPVLDIPVNKQWPRVYENFGEDPHLSGVMGVAAIRGYQGQYKSDRSKVAACMKHFIAYGAPWSGQDRDSTVVSDRTINDYFVPPFQMAIDAGVATAMESYIDINGEPVVASEKYLRQLLREQMGFKGMLVTDWAEIENLYTTHRVAASHKDAVHMSIKSTSIDMSMVPKDVIFFETLQDLVNDGQIPMERIDESVERLLQLKKDLGLLERDGWKARRELQSMVGQPSDARVSLDAARESLTLLKNANATLPLQDRYERILVVGPSANDLGHLSGGWTINWQGATKDAWQGPIDDEQFYSNGISIHDGMKLVAPANVDVDYMAGFDIDGTSIDMDQVLAVASSYDAIVVCLGEHVYSELPGNIHDMALPSGQVNAVEMIAKVGKPMITVLIEGRPRVLGSIPEQSNALLQAYLPGPWGGLAIAEALFGKLNPSGLLPYTYPKYVGDVNLNYWRQVNDVWDPLYEFGHGLSYSTFEYSNLTLYDGASVLQENRQLADSPPVLKPGEPVKVAVKVTNKGPFDGKQTVLMYVQQPVRRITPPVKVLKAFQKIDLEKGKSATVVFTVDADMFRYTGMDGVARGTLDHGPVRILINEHVMEFNLQP
ncbi:glycoside hydrolase superfamily [Radiomyces spectabilis]|uniref:glycoside hydrolase superfamily n=1 Tax=Radiomyces spectabilis TaxID=64574 RepID=UPI00221F4529|nr:glycoside hydrolase superfamily [Radiomyces spectabilis]KAI8367532.1 glycoside hydrolase superfamily [Radiomyces spectabilis]